jgi:hypothetical protein
MKNFGISLFFLFFFLPLFIPPFTNLVSADENSLKQTLDKIVIDTTEGIYEILEHNKKDIKKILKQYFSNVTEEDLEKIISYDYTGNADHLLALQKELMTDLDNHNFDAIYEKINSFLVNEIKVSNKCAKDINGYLKNIPEDEDTQKIIEKIIDDTLSCFNMTLDKNLEDIAKGIEKYLSNVTEQDIKKILSYDYKEKAKPLLLLARDLNNPDHIVYEKVYSFLLNEIKIGKKGAEEIATLLKNISSVWKDLIKTLGQLKEYIFLLNSTK